MKTIEVNPVGFYEIERFTKTHECGGHQHIIRLCSLHGELYIEEIDTEWKSHEKDCGENNDETIKMYRSLVAYWSQDEE